MAIPVSYAGVYLPFVDANPRFMGWAHGAIDWTWLTEFAHKDWLLWHGGIRRLPPIHAGDVWWPRDASRFAVGHFFATADQVRRIRAVVQASSTLAPADLVLGESVTIPMYMLPARPITYGNPDLAMHLLTLVDERFFWWFRAANITVSEGVTTWGDLYSQLESGLSTLLYLDPISSSYVNPPGELNSSYEPLPVLLDAVAQSCGQRIVRGYDGTVRAMSASSSRDILDANLVTQTSNAILRGVKGGGLFSFDPDLPNDLACILPASVTVAFRMVIDGTLQTTRYPIQVSFGDLTIPALDGTEVKTFSGTKRLQDVAKAYFIGAGADPVNLGSLLLLAREIAADYYQFTAGGKVDVNFAGFRNWTPEGFSEDVLFRWGGSTRILRGTWDDTSDNLYHLMPVPSSISGSAGSAGSGSSGSRIGSSGSSSGSGAAPCWSVRTSGGSLLSDDPDGSATPYDGQPFTMSFWFYLPLSVSFAANQQRTLFTFGPSASAMVELGVGTFAGLPVFYAGDQRLDFNTTNVPIPRARWNHVAWSFDGSIDGVLYLNGVPEQFPYGNLMYAISLTGSNRQWGRSLDGTRTCDANFLDFRLYASALDSIAIGRIYNNGCPTFALDLPSAPLYGWWKFREGAGIVAYDSSSHELPALLSSAIWEAFQPCCGSGSGSGSGSIGSLSGSSGSGSGSSGSGVSGSSGSSGVSGISGSVPPSGGSTPASGGSTPGSTAGGSTAPSGGSTPASGGSTPGSTASGAASGSLSGSSGSLSGSSGSLSGSSGSRSGSSGSTSGSTSGGTGSGTNVGGTCCGVILPAILHVTRNYTPAGQCTCSDGLVVMLTWNPTTSKWEGTAAFGTCGRDITIKAYCIGQNLADWRFDAAFSSEVDCVGPETGNGVAGGPSSCSPLSVPFRYGPTGPSNNCGCTGIVALSPFWTLTL